MTPPADQLLAHLRAVVSAADHALSVEDSQQISTAVSRLRVETRRARLFLAQHGALHAPQEATS